MVSSFQTVIGDSNFSVEAGKLAQKANGSVLIKHGDSVVLVTATMASPREGVNFFPLTIDFEERMYARGKIPGSFFRREGRPSVDAILIDRLIDRPLRPLFPKDFRNEVQVIITAMSADMETPLDIMSLIGASLALSVSDIPFGGPIGATRIGYIDGEYIINPTYHQMEESQLDLVVAGTKDGVAMMEAGASELSEELVLGAMRLAQEENLKIIQFQENIVTEIGKPKSEYQAKGVLVDVQERVSELSGARLTDAVKTNSGTTPDPGPLTSLEKEVVEALEGDFDSANIGQAFDNLVNDEIRRRILRDQARPDGRTPREIRPITCEVGLLPRTHGTGLFQRGETQALGVVTLGSIGDAQRLDTLHPRETKRFLMHYNFPPYSTGEAKRVGSTGRREVGHGALAERALLSVLPTESEFPYAIRVVSEVLSSNGSTSMASTCASTLALMDAGVPIKAPVAGISVGLVADENSDKFVILTDIQGREDHIGDMDFKVAGTVDGITAIQLDIKVTHISWAVIEATLEQAKEARLFLLDKMREAISETRNEMSKYAPRIMRIGIPIEKIGMVIGPGGKTIRGIIEQTGATVDVQDDGTIFIGSPDAEAAQKAVNMIEAMTEGAKVGETYTGKVVKILDFGAFVEILPGTDGMVHISELAHYRVNRVEDILAVGDEVAVKVKDIDQSGRISLSRKALISAEDNAKGTSEDEPREPGYEEQSSDRPANPPHRGPRPRGGGYRGGSGGGQRQGGGYGQRRQGSGGPPRDRH